VGDRARKDTKCDLNLVLANLNTQSYSLLCNVYKAIFKARYATSLLPIAKEVKKCLAAIN